MNTEVHIAVVYLSLLLGAVGDQLELAPSRSGRRIVETRAARSGGAGQSSKEAGSEVGWHSISRADV